VKFTTCSSHRPSTLRGGPIRARAPGVIVGRGLVEARSTALSPVGHDYVAIYHAPLTTPSFSRLEARTKRELGLFSLLYKGVPRFSLNFSPPCNSCLHSAPPPHFSTPHPSHCIFLPHNEPRPPDPALPSQENASSAQGCACLRAAGHDAMANHRVPQCLLSGPVARRSAPRCCEFAFVCTRSMHELTVKNCRSSIFMSSGRGGHENSGT
jgi:hypothetical protein